MEYESEEPSNEPTSGRGEAEADQVAVNTRGAGEGQKPAPVAVDEFIARVRREIETRALTVEAGVVR